MCLEEPENLSVSHKRERSASAKHETTRAMLRIVEYRERDRAPVLSTKNERYFSSGNRVRLTPRDHMRSSSPKKKEAMRLASQVANDTAENGGRMIFIGLGPRLIATCFSSRVVTPKYGGYHTEPQEITICLGGCSRGEHHPVPPGRADITVDKLQVIRSDPYVR